MLAKEVRNWNYYENTSGSIQSDVTISVSKGALADSGPMATSESVSVLASTESELSGSSNVKDKDTMHNDRTRQVSGCTASNTRMTRQVLPQADINPNSAVKITDAELEGDDIDLE